jgi:sugar lactone lactonase YvrE
VLAAALIVVPAALDRPRSAHAAPGFQVLATPGGQPDDITVDERGRLLWGNLSRGTVERLQAGRLVTVLRHLSVPEGLVACPGGVLYVAEQGFDRIDRISSRGGLTVLHRLVPVPGQEGVDAISWDPRSHTLLVPDSPRGIVVSLDPATGRERTLASGLGRPVDAATGRSSNILVPDEHLGTLGVISPGGRVTYRGRFNTPDDVAVDRHGNVWVTSLGDNSLWEIPTDGPQRLVASNLGQPQGLTLDACGDPIVTEQTTGRIVRVLLTARSRTCRF